MLNQRLNDVRVISAGLGGGFGGKGSGITSGAAVEPICGLLAIKAKRAVMIVLDKAEETISTTSRSGARMYIKTGVKKDGTILARTGKVFYDAGGYSGFGVQAGGRGRQRRGGEQGLGGGEGEKSHVEPPGSGWGQNAAAAGGRQARRHSWVTRA